MKTADFKTELEKNGVISFVPKGNSMWPFLKNGKQSVLMELKKNRLKKYDVAFYARANGDYVLHRVIEVLPQGYIMQGDSQLSREPVAENDVFGVMKGFYKGKTFVCAEDEKYLKKVDKWFKKSKTRAIKIKVFYLKERVKNKLKKIFKGKKENV